MFYHKGTMKIEEGEHEFKTWASSSLDILTLKLPFLSCWPL